MRKFIAHPENIWPPIFLIFPCGAHFVEKKLMSLRFYFKLYEKTNKIPKNY